MAIILKEIEYLTKQQSGLPQPIIYCKNSLEKADGANSLNIPLAKALSGVKPSRRTMRLEQSFRQVLADLPDNPVIKDFDVLFNPEYKVDILRIMASIGKNKPYQIIWPGKYENGRLIYAEEGYLDYKVFDLDKYDVTCII